MGEFIEAMASGESFLNAMSETIRALGIFALGIVLIIGLVFFAPSIIASLRDIKWKNIVTVVNVVSILAMFIYFPLVIIAWLVLMILAFIGMKKLR